MGPTNNHRADKGVPTSGATLDLTAFPHIQELIVSYCDPKTAMALRLTSRALYLQLPLHIVIDPEGNIWNARNFQRLHNYDLRLAAVIDTHNTHHTFEDPGLVCPVNPNQCLKPSPTASRLRQVRLFPIVRSRAGACEYGLTARYNPPGMQVLQQSHDPALRSELSWDSPIPFKIVKSPDFPGMQMVIHLLPDPSQLAGPSLPTSDPTDALEWSANKIASGLSIYIQGYLIRGRAERPIIVGIDEAQAWWGHGTGEYTIKENLVHKICWYLSSMLDLEVESDTVLRELEFMTIKEYAEAVGEIQYGMETSMCDRKARMQD